jgi:ParB family chromosome partitioning protein
MAIKLSDALQRVKAGIADFESDFQADYASSLDPTEVSSSASVAAPLTSIDQPSVTRLKLQEIVVPEARIRKYFDAEKTASLVRSISRYGFRGVLWVRPVSGQYHLVAGGRRYVACQQAGIEEVTVEIWDITDAEAIQLELLENFQREDLNPVEETEGVLRMLEVTLGLNRSEVITLLNWKARQQREQIASDKTAQSRPSADQPDTDNVIRKEADVNDERWEIVESVFKVIGKFSPESFRTNRLPLLNLPEPILDAICTGKIEYTKARLIGRIKDEQQRDVLLTEAIDQGLSHEEITRQVRQLQSDQPTLEQRAFRTRASRILKRLNTTALTGRSLKKAETLLSELEALLSSKE